MMIRMKTSFLPVLALLALLSGCRDARLSDGPAPLSEDELACITGSDSVMRVLSVFDPADSLVLRTASADFTPEDLRSEAFRILSAKLLATVTSPDQDGVGIAAPQVGLNRRVVAVQRFDREGEPFGVFPNARLDSLYGEVKGGPEGCLSIPGWRGRVPRAAKIIVSYTDPQTLGRVRETVEGFTAVIFQHEIDHLEGILYTDRADSLWRVDR